MYYPIASYQPVPILSLLISKTLLRYRQETLSKLVLLLRDKTKIHSSLYTVFEFPVSVSLSRILTWVPLLKLPWYLPRNIVDIDLMATADYSGGSDSFGSVLKLPQLKRLT